MWKAFKRGFFAEDIWLAIGEGVVIYAAILGALVLFIFFMSCVNRFLR